MGEEDLQPKISTTQTTANMNNVSCNSMKAHTCGECLRWSLGHLSSPEQSTVTRAQAKTTVFHVCSAKRSPLFTEHHEGASLHGISPYCFCISAYIPKLDVCGFIEQLKYKHKPA